MVQAVNLGGQRVEVGPDREWKVLPQGGVLQQIEIGSFRDFDGSSKRAGLTRLPVNLVARKMQRDREGSIETAIDPGRVSHMLTIGY